MSDTFLEHNSFKFGTIDMWEKWQLRILDVVDYLKPKLRSRKVNVPLRHGDYDYGAKYYDERVLSLKCLRMSDISRHDQSLLAYDLAQKNEIRLYDDPEKYYVGRIYTEPELSPIRNGGLQVNLEFTCEPFRYRNTLTSFFVNNKYTPEYDGTASTPTYIVITNTSATAQVKNIRITQAIKRENY